MILKWALEWTLAMVSTVCLMVTLRPAAKAIGLVDRPGGRKIHTGEIPLTGGIAMIAGLAVTLAVGEYGSPTLPYFVACVMILGTIGVIDDRFGLRPRIRLVVQTGTTLLMVFGAGITIDDLGHLLPDTRLTLGSLEVPLTVLITLTAVNAFNMFDGSDGIAGGQAVVGCAFLATAALVSGSLHLLPLLIAFSGCVSGFLFFNWPSKRRRHIHAFMGDGGSTVLGFALAWFSIELTQGPREAIAPVVALWIFALPVWDLFSSMLRRIAAGRSPFSPDADHLHHVLRRFGLTPRKIAQLLLFCSVVLSTVGLAGYYAGVPDGVLLGAWTLLAVVYHVVFGSGLVVKRRRVPRSQSIHPYEPELWVQRLGGAARSETALENVPSETGIGGSEQAA